MANDELAGIEYHGISGSTVDCLRAIERLLHFGEQIQNALLLSCSDHEHSTSHGFLLTNAVGDPFAIKSGFSSGYGGTGPRGLSSALSLLHWHGVELEEIEVQPSTMERLDLSALTEADLDQFKAARRVRPRRLWEYVLEGDDIGPERKNPWRNRFAPMPFAMVDDRLADLALSFWENPDIALFQGHRRLETIVRERIGWAEDEAAPNASKMYGAAFNVDNARLTWPNVTKGERQGRAHLFVGTAMAHRNPRAHREGHGRPDDQLGEFLLLNQLFKLERAATPCSGSGSGGERRRNGDAQRHGDT